MYQASEQRETVGTTQVLEDLASGKFTVRKDRLWDDS